MKRKILSLVLVLLATVTGVTFSLSPAAATALESNRYVAMGDSVAAGAGLMAMTNTPEDQLCARSSSAYPHRVSRALGMSLEHLACSGAKADEGLYGEQEREGTTLAPQLDSAFAAGTPDLITITIGANDVRWAEFVQQCYAWDCGGAVDDGLASAYLLDLRWELYRTLRGIKHRSMDFMPRVILTGYFTPLSTTAPSCADTRNFSTQEITWLNTQAAALNQVIAQAASWYSFVEYVPVDFSGHELCTAHPWVQGVADPAPFHPTVVGQMAYSRAVLSAIRN